MKSKAMAPSSPRPGRPSASSPDALARMERQRRRDTGPELALRRLLHRRGLRYRVDCPALPGSRRRHDLVFTKARTAVEVRGCFWHSCPLHATAPKANAEWWSAKLAANTGRDASTARQLEKAGWALVVVWEHEDPAVAAERVAAVVRSRRALYGEGVAPSVQLRDPPDKPPRTRGAGTKRGR